MKTPTQEEARKALKCLFVNALSVVNRIKALAEERDDMVRRIYASQGIVESALEAKAHSKADCLRVAAEWLGDPDLGSPVVNRGWNEARAALRAEVARLEDRAAFDEAADQLAAKYGLPPSGRSGARKTE